MAYGGRLLKFTTSPIHFIEVQRIKFLQKVAICTIEYNIYNYCLLVYYLKLKWEECA